MKPEIQLVIDIVMIVGAGAGGWIMKMIWDRINKNEERTDALVDEVGKLQILVAGDYVKAIKFDEVINRIFTKLDEIQKEIRDKK